MTPAPVGPADAARGIALMVAAIAVFATMDAVIKGLRGDYGTIQILFFRMAVAAIPTLALVLAQGGLARLRTRRLGGHIGRTLLVLAALGCFFFAFGRLPLADVYAISYAAPLIATALSVPLLGESVGLRRWTAIGVGFAGVVVILQPGGSVFGPAGGLALIGTVLFAANLVLLRQLSRTETDAAIVFYFTVTGTLVTGAMLPFGWTWPVGTDWLMLLTVGLLGGVGQILITSSLRLAPIAIVTPFQYTSILWGSVFGYFFFGDTLTAPTAIGAAIVVASGVYILYRETRRQAADRL